MTHTQIAPRAMAGYQTRQPGCSVSSAAVLIPLLELQVDNSLLKRLSSVPSELLLLQPNASERLRWELLCYQAVL